MSSDANMPAVSIGFPVYNGGEFLQQAIDSILKQDFADFELVIVDNASTDNTPAICEFCARRDPRVRYFRNEINIGVNPNHDRVFELSRGKYFMWAAHDVEFLPGMLRRCMEVMKVAPASVVLVYPRCEMIFDGLALAYDRRNSIESKDCRPYRRMETVARHIVMVNQLYGLMKAEALRKTRLNGPYASSDYVLLAELAMLGEIWEIPETMIRRRIDSDRGTAAVYKNQGSWRSWLANNKAKAMADWLPYRERLAFEYFRGAWHLPLKLKDKLLCLAVAPCLPYGRYILRVTGPWRHKCRHWFGRASAG